MRKDKGRSDAENRLLTEQSLVLSINDGAQQDVGILHGPLDFALPELENTVAGRKPKPAASVRHDLRDVGAYQTLPQPNLIVVRVFKPHKPSAAAANPKA